MWDGLKIIHRFVRTLYAPAASREKKKKKLKRTVSVAKKNLVYLVILLV